MFNDLSVSGAQMMINVVMALALVGIVAVAAFYGLKKLGQFMVELQKDQDSGEDSDQFALGATDEETARRLNEALASDEINRRIDSERERKMRSSRSYRRGKLVQGRTYRYRTAKGIRTGTLSHWRTKSGKQFSARVRQPHSGRLVTVHVDKFVGVN